VKIPGFLKKRPVQLGIAGAALLGVISLVRRQSGGGGTGGGDGTTPQSVTPAVMDSSGTDVYNAIQSLGQGWENDLREYTAGLASLTTQVQNNTKGLADVTTALGKIKQPSSTVKPPIRTGPAVSAIPGLNKKLPSGRGFHIIKAGETWQSVSSKYGITVDTLKRLNPGGKLTHFGVGESVRVRAAAGPPPKGAPWR